jgi:hypothetical protein
MMLESGFGGAEGEKSEYQKFASKYQSIFVGMPTSKTKRERKREKREESERAKGK